MAEFVRFGVYYVPPDGPLARFGAGWLGWDVARGVAAEQPAISGLDVAHVTATPRKYGFHATLKPPFRLAAGTTAGALETALAGLAETLTPIRLRGLRLARLDGFLALVPDGDAAALEALAALLVAGLDRFRAPPGPVELARRRAGGLTAAQEANLIRWGYPYVMEEFRFHMTLSGSLADPAPAEAALAPLLAPVLPVPFVVDAVALVGERADGMFQLVHRYALSASSAASA